MLQKWLSKTRVKALNPRLPPNEKKYKSLLCLNNSEADMMKSCFLRYMPYFEFQWYTKDRYTHVIFYYCDFSVLQI